MLDSPLAQPARRSDLALLVLWLLSGVLLFVSLGTPPVQRTQEARVLETAREMLGRPARDWLIPHLNGEVRLRKPPLAYWMAAAAFEIFGVGEAAGRLPTVLCGWLTICVTYCCAAWLFGRVAGFLSAAALLGSYMFFGHFRLAETDAPATLFVTLAIYAMWRGATPAEKRSAFWYHVSAPAMALVIMARGLPAVHPALFFLGLAAVTRRWRILLDWVVSGAPMTLLIIALPWWIYVATSSGSHQITQALHTIATGEDHPRPVWDYFPQLLLAVAPWSGFIILALAHAIRSWRSDPRLRGILIWIAAILVPLCVAPNRQRHYLLPLMPPLMILVGWLLDLVRTGAADASLRRVVKFVFYATVIALIGVGCAVAVAARVHDGAIRFADVALGGAVLGGCAFALAASRRNLAAGPAALVITTALLMPLLVGVWLPRHFDRDPRVPAAQLRATFGDGPYCFWGQNISLPLCFAMRTTIPQVETSDELMKLLEDQPGLIVIAQTKSGIAPPPLPRGFEPRMQIDVSEQKFEIYRSARPEAVDGGLPVGVTGMKDR